MKKKLYIGLAILAGLLLGVYLVLIFGLGSFVTKAVNSYGPSLTKSSVKLTAAHISPFSGEGTLDDLTVGNPQGWSDKNAFTLKRIHVSVAPRSIFSNLIVIREIEIDAPEFNYETKITSSNIGQLVQNLEGQKNNDAAQVKTKTGEPQRFEIDHLVIKDGRILVSVSGMAPVSMAMPTVDYHDLGAGGQGVTSSELAALVGRTLLTTVAQSAAKSAGKVLPAAGDVLKGASGALQGLFKH